MDQPELQNITAFLEQHRQAFPRDVLRQHLLEHGARPELVDLGLVKVFGYQMAQPQLIAPTIAPPQRVPARGSVAFLTICGNLLLPLIGIFLLGLLTGNGFLGGVAAGWVLALVAIPIEFVVAHRLKRGSDPATGEGLFAGAVGSSYLVGLLLFFLSILSVTL